MIIEVNNFLIELFDQYQDSEKHLPQTFEVIPESQRSKLEDLNSNDREIVCAL
jgi:hypothetical protein